MSNSKCTKSYFCYEESNLIACFPVSVNSFWSFLMSDLHLDPPNLQTKQVQSSQKLCQIR